jgi:YHS domain-containing protein
MNRNRKSIAQLVAVGLLLAVGAAGTVVALAGGDGHDGHSHAASKSKAPAADGATKAIKSAAYPLDICPVTGEKLGSMGDPVVYDHEGREIKFCCAGCIEEFEANADKYIAEIDKKIIAKQSKSYPLTTCVVTDEPLGSMGDTIDLVYKNRLVRFCCEGCIDEFNSDPATYIGKIDKAAKAKAEKAKSAKTSG